MYGQSVVKDSSREKIATAGVHVALFLVWIPHILDKKVRSWAITENSLKSSIFEHLEFKGELNKKVLFHLFVTVIISM